MAKARRNRNTPPARAVKLPPEIVAAMKVPPEIVEAVKLAEAIKPPPGFAEAIKLAEEWAAEPDPGEDPSGLPTDRPAGVGPKVWLAAQTVLALKCEGRVWADRGVLHRMVAERIGDERISKRTLASGISFLRDRRLI